MKIQKQPLPWALWLRQIRAIFRLEIEKNFLGRRSILLYLLALLPIVPLALLAPFTPPGREWHDFTQYNMIFAIFYGGLILRTVVFFGCAWIFMNLFRGDIVDRSLHFYFLSPVRREVLVVGKYLSGLVTSIILFQRHDHLACCCFISPFFFGERRFFFDGPGLGQLLTYAGITILACVGYGAFFLVVGLFFRNPIIPAHRALRMGVAQLPDAAAVEEDQRDSLSEFAGAGVPVSEGPFAVVAEPTPAWIAMPA